MDTNDQRPSEPENNQYNPVQVSQPAGNGYNNGYYGNPYNGGSGNRGGGRPRGLAVVIAIIMVICLVVGGIFTAYVIMPGIYPSLRGDDNFALATPDKSGSLSENNDGSDTNDKTGLATDFPDIGGEAPDIDYTESPIVQIAEDVSPSVVLITVTVPGYDFGGQTDDSVGWGTGSIISPDGYIVTNYHVLEGSKSITVTLNDGTEYPAEVIGGDVATDLSIIRISAADLKAIAFGDSDSLQIGEQVVAIGNPLGELVGDLTNTVTTGIISGINREINASGYTQTYIQTDAAINSGNSGGPLLNMKGEMIGINTIKFSSVGIEGLGFAIPINTAKSVIDQLIKKGSVERPGIGITCIVDETNAYNPSGSPEGVTVISVTSGGPADIAGIEPNDIIISVEGTAVKAVEDLTGMIQSHKVGDEINVTVWRSGHEYKQKIKVGDLNNMG